MSIHAQLSSEAKAKLLSQKRKSTISSIILSVLICVLLVIILFFISLTPFFKNTEELVTYSAPNTSVDEVVKPENNNEVKKKPSSPSSSLSKVIATKTPSATSIPVPDQLVNEPSLNFGDGDDFGDGWGDGDGSGGGGAGGSGGFNIPASMQKRCSAKDRIERLIKEGGLKEYEDQVVKGLEWLQSTQSSNGSWAAQSRPAAMTGLSLLAFLGHCETPSSVKFGETVEKAILYLISLGIENDGKLSSNTSDKFWCYEHAIATYALAEAYTLCKEFNIPIPKLKEVVMAAGKHILETQHSSGGWDYLYDTSGKRGGDSSIVCWHLQALKACKTTGISFRNIEKAGRDGVDYLESLKNGKNTIGYAKSSDKDKAKMTPGAALCFQQWGRGKRSFARSNIQWINDNNDFNYRTNGDLYMNYYSSQAMINAGGDDWKKYNTQTMSNLAKSQNADGSWPLPGNTAHQMKSSHYSTCLSILMMEVYYRFLPSSE